MEKNMKHKTIEAIDLAYNLVKIGGNSCVRYTNILGGYYSGECKEFVNQVRKYGYDVLSKTDQGFKEKLDSYNRVLELQAKKNGLSSYTKHEFDELCVCGDWIFMEHDCVTESEEVAIKDARGGKREGAGRKSKHKNLIHTETTTIRVPKYYKNEIKGLIDFIFEEEPGKPDVKEAFYKAYMEVVAKANLYKDENLKRSAEFLQDFWDKLPFITREKQE